MRLLSSQKRNLRAKLRPHSSSQIHSADFDLAHLDLLALACCI